MDFSSGGYVTYPLAEYEILVWVRKQCPSLMDRHLCYCHAQLPFYEGKLEAEAQSTSIATTCISIRTNGPRGCYFYLFLHLLHARWTGRFLACNDNCLNLLRLRLHCFNHHGDRSLLPADHHGYRMRSDRLDMLADIDILSRYYDVELLLERINNGGLADGSV